MSCFYVVFLLFFSCFSIVFSYFSIGFQLVFSCFPPPQQASKKKEENKTKHKTKKTASNKNQLKTNWKTTEKQLKNNWKTIQKQQKNNRKATQTTHCWKARLLQNPLIFPLNSILHTPFNPTPRFASQGHTSASASICCLYCVGRGFSKTEMAANGH